MNTIDSEIIVVGAGIAGLTAAWQLKQSGKQVLVLEASPVTGGRMRTEYFEGALVDCGAQFLSSAYTIIPKLIEQTGLSKEFVETSPWAGLINNQHISLLHFKKPWTLWSQGVLTYKDFIRFVFNQLRMYKSIGVRSLNDYAEWVELDDDTASSWATRHFGNRVARQLTAALLDGFYFQSLDNTSAAMITAVTAFGRHNHRTMTLATGIGSLPQKLAEGLNVICNAQVDSVRQTNSGVEIAVNDIQYRAQQAVLAVPAPFAKKILHNPDKETQPLLDTPYCSSANLIFLTSESWQPPARLASTYGFIAAPDNTNKIAALTLEKNKHPGRVQHGHLSNVMLSSQYAEQLLQLNDDEIYAAIKSEVEWIFPDIYKFLRGKRVYRWPFAMPCSPIGRAHQVKAYRESRRADNRIWLAGDYLGLPYTDSAAATGLWAAQQILQPAISTAV